ncbi:aldehyde dehydrogenase [Candidatus Koribacter versatilis Ellin345]|uniref:Aldehyde dehydrogenase n=1 Tax=Koribacter versatilis (strain Ellin345) TaxID=204669 RepID=Q1IRG7_KORVE|nr:aldehyde dehydrogenase family protein [Candidatus Koribacter versatilis]ABF40533.1 aldehyde dehydrogenase [Candidatus Koribacter versatilis Ellin345]
MSEIVAAPAASYPFLLNGEWISDGSPVEIHSPFDHKVIGQVFYGSSAHVEAAIRASVEAFQITRKLGSYERERILSAISQKLSEQREDFAHTIALEAGKPIKTARQEVERAIYTFKVAAEESTRIEGEYLHLDTIEATKGRWGIVRRFPIGPIFAITPFNFPLNLVAHKLAPAIAAGCPVILKPAPQTPITALKLARVIHESGWPAGALTVMPLSNEDASLLVTDERIKLLTFTGSSIGWDLKSKAGKKRVLLELGGNAAIIIHSDADLRFAAERCAHGAFGYAGQSCISVQRILVEKSVYSEFRQMLVNAAGKLKTGDPLDEATDVGPLIRESDALRAESWVKEAVAQGATLLCGGTRKGSLLEPTVLTNTRPEMLVNCREIFAPVVTVEAYDDFNEALRQVNNSPFGLQAGILTRDAQRIFTAFNGLDVGGVVAGDVPTFRIDHMPYGGIKDSGLGREGVRYTIEEMTEPKLLVMNLGA